MGLIRIPEFFRSLSVQRQIFLCARRNYHQSPQRKAAVARSRAGTLETKHQHLRKGGNQSKPKKIWENQRKSNRIKGNQIKSKRSEHLYRNTSKKIKKIELNWIYQVLKQNIQVKVLFQLSEQIKRLYRDKTSLPIPYTISDASLYQSCSYFKH